jgi:competence protein ComEC
LENPALYLGISALNGALMFFEHAYWIALLWLGYLFFLFPLKGLFHSLLLISIFLFSHLLFSDLPAPGMGRAVFSIHSVQSHSSPFHKGWLYQGSLRAFQSASGEWALNLPCAVVYTGDFASRPKADGDYLLTGQLRQRGAFDFTFKTKSWEKIDKTWSLAEFRYNAKERVHSILRQHLKDSHTSAFLSALFTGDIENRMLRFEFSRIGLQYLLVISGFHFAILSAFIAFALRLILPSRKRLWALLFAITLYFLFVGNTPPVLRSFLAASIFLIGQILERRASGLNILGACLLIEVLCDPIIVRNIGFQLSFLSCFGIFILNAPIKKLFEPYLPVRPLSEIIAFSLPSQCGYLLSSFFSHALRLTIAVNLALFPLLLHHFHRFPYLSLIYNLFTPAWTALSLFLLLMAITAYAFFPLLSLPLFQIVDFIAGNLLELIGHPPVLLDYGISCHYPGWALFPYIALLFIISQHRRQKAEEFGNRIK